VTVSKTVRRQARKSGEKNRETDHGGARSIKSRNHGARPCVLSHSGARMIRRVATADCSTLAIVPEDADLFHAA